MAIRFPVSVRKPLGVFRRIWHDPGPPPPEPPAPYVQQPVAARTPVALVVLTVDRCALVFGQGPCTATGTPCYNTWSTCRIPSAYSRVTHDLKFSSVDAPLPFDFVRPYLKEGGVRLNPTEIRAGLSFDGQPLRTVSGRISVEMLDEPDGDVGIDPYLSVRLDPPRGTYWKKFIARNRNYYGRPLRVYEGFLGDAEEDFALKWAGKIENISMGRGMVRIEAADILRDLSRIEIPPKVSITTLTVVSAEETTAVSLSSVDGLPASGFVQIGEEIVGYSGVDAASRQITGLSRGQFGTSAAASAVKSKVSIVRQIAPTNPWDLLVGLLESDAGMAPADVDEASFAYWRDWPGGDPDFSTVLTEPVKLDRLVTEIVDLLDARIWVNEDMQVTIRRNIPNRPGRSYVDVTDDLHLIHQSGSVDLNEKSRITRLAVYWDKTPLGKADDVQSYGRVDIAVDADAEGESGYGSVTEKKLFCRWIGLTHLQEETAARYMRNLAMRQVARYSDAQPLVSFEVDLKDASIRTGDYLRLSTDELLRTDGSPIDRQVFQVVKRGKRKADRIAVTAMATGTRRVAIIAPASMAGRSYADATLEEREYGFIAGSDGRVSDGTRGYAPW